MKPIMAKCSLKCRQFETYLGHLVLGVDCLRPISAVYLKGRLFETYLGRFSLRCGLFEFHKVSAVYLKGRLLETYLGHLAVGVDCMRPI